MIVYIHGASATAESFTHIRQFVRSRFNMADCMIEYASDDGFDHNLECMKQRLLGSQALFFVSHSLGGIYALHLAHHYREFTKGGISLSTPYGGSEQADFARYFLPFNRLMKDVGVMSSPMREARELPAPQHWTQIVTTAGQSPWIYDHNDGVVTVKSMRARSDFEIIDLPLNHYEVVLSDRVAEIVSDRISRVLS